METKEIDSSGVVVQLRTSEAFLRKENSSPTAQDSITALFEKNGVSVREIKSDGPYWAFERAIRETQKSLNQKVNKEWQKNKSYMDTRTQYMFNKVSSERAGGTYELIIKDTNYSKEETGFKTMVGKYACEHDTTVRTGPNYGQKKYKVYSINDTAKISETLNRTYKFEQEYYRQDMWMHYLRRTVLNLTGAIQLESGLIWIPTKLTSTVDTEFSGSKEVRNDAALAYIQSLCKNINDYKPADSNGSRTTLHILRYQPDEADDWHATVMNTLSDEIDTLSHQFNKDVKDIVKKQGKGKVRNHSQKRLWKKIEDTKDRVKQMTSLIKGHDTTFKRADRCLIEMAESYDKLQNHSGKSYEDIVAEEEAKAKKQAEAKAKKESKNTVGKKTTKKPTKKATKKTTKKVSNDRSKEKKPIAKKPIAKKPEAPPLKRKPNAQELLAELKEKRAALKKKGKN